MNNLNQEIFKYVDSHSGSWADSTITTNYSKLVTINDIGWTDPDRVFKELSARKFSKYTIQTYFWIAKDFEEKVKKTQRFKQWIDSNRLKFKNCYKEKTKRITKIEYDSFLQMSREKASSYNFLVLTGHFGLRKSEALKARWEDFQNGRFCVQSGKGGKQRFLPRQFSIKLLKDKKEKGTIAVSPINFQFLKPFTPHDLRHYAVTNWINVDKLSLKEAALLAGHSSILTTARYVKADLSEIEEKLGLNEISL